MLRKPALLLWALALLGSAFFAGALRLLQLRLSHGDVYPPYSSLRSDPLGCKVLYESLGTMDGVVSLRNFRPWNKALSSASGTLLLLGLGPRAFGSMDQAAAGFLEDFLRNGGRVVVALRSDPEADDETFEDAVSKPARGARRRELPPAGQKRKKPDDPRKEEIPAFLQDHTVDLGDRFGVTISDRPKGGREIGLATPANGSLAASGRLEPLVWHGSLHFDPLNAAWKTAYFTGSSPVVIERPFGRGALVLCADSYPFSNEAVFKEPAPGFTSWSLGPSRLFLFDETHLNVLEKPGVTSLLRQYRLHGLVLGCLFLALLFIWKNASPLLPPSETGDGSDSGAVPGREAFQGLTGLLRRSIPPDHLLQVCCEEWRKQYARRDPPAAARLEALLAARAGSAHAPAALYREIQDTLHRKTLK